jgi:hypothetical protein
MKLRTILLVFGASLSTMGTAMAGTWRSVAIGGGGFVTGMAASTDGSAVYMRTDVGGAYRWDAPNTQWRPITDSLPNDTNNNGHLYGIGAIAVDPANANRVFLACGKYNYSNPSGIYTCTNTSVTNPTWTVVDSTVRVIGNGGFRTSGERLAVDPYNSNVVYFGTYNIGGVAGLRKYYYDTAWHTTTLAVPANGDVDYGISFVAADRTGGSVSDGTRTVSKYLYIGVYSATNNAGGVFASSNGGASWTKVTGLTFDKPFRGEVDSAGTLFVSGNGNVAKVARGATAFTSITPVAGLAYTGLAVDPNVAGTVMVAEVRGSNRIWRSLNGGGAWVLMVRNAHGNEPDGTRSLTCSNGTFDNIADLMVTPGLPDEVWASDFAGVQRTQNIKDDSSASDWYTVQKNHEEVVGLMLKSAPTGAPMLSAVADCNGFAHDDPEVRPTVRFDNPRYISSTGLDFSEADGGAVWARAGDIFYYTGTDADRTGGTSINGGRNWASFGQLDARSLTNSPTGAWETFDVGHYLRQRKASGVNVVTLVVRSSAWQTNQRFLHFSSKEGSNPPQLLIDGATTLTPTADAMVYMGAPTTNYGNSTELQAQNYYDQAGYLRWSYLKFDLSSASSVTSAVLRLYRLGISDTTGATYATVIHATPTTNWVEGDGDTNNVPAGELTWNNKPTDLCAPPSGATGGRVALSATDPARLVWVPENGYVWHSKDRGMTWARGTRSGVNLAVDSMSEFTTDRNPLASDRVATNTVYAYAKTGSGTVYRSTDGGATWATLVTGVGTANGYKLLSVPGMAGKIWYLDQNWNVAAHFKYWTGSVMTNVPGITTAVDFAFGKAAPGRTNPVVYVRKANGSYWASVDATAGATFTWVQVDAPAVNCQPTVMEGDRQRYGRLYVGTGGRGLFYADVMPDSAQTIAWTGGTGGTGTSWNSGANWDGGAVPGADDTAVFAGSGLSAGKVIALGANQTIAKLVLATTTAFTIGAASDVTAGYALTLTEVDRQDVAGTEGLHVFGATVTLAPDAGTNSVWTVNGSDVLRMNGVLGAATATTFVKKGTGTLNLNYASPTFAGPWSIVEGAVTATVANSMRGNATVGGTAVAASLTQSVKNALYGSMNITALDNGTFTAGDIDNGRVNSLHVHSGGLATIGSYFYGYKAYLTGGLLNGGCLFNGGFGQELRSYASPDTAVFNAAFRFSSYYDAVIDAEDGFAPIDLRVSKALEAGGSAKKITKSGSGVAQLTAASTTAYGTFNVSGGTLLVDNASGSGTGQAAVTVAGGATLGGAGSIGGVSGYSNANVSVTGVSSSSIATLAPGTASETDGSHVPGTLTVGSASQANNVTFGSHSRLHARFWSDGSHDRLTVVGAVALSGTSDTLELSVPSDTPVGTYTLVSAANGVSGVFDTVVGLPSGAQLNYSANAITLTLGGSLQGVSMPSSSEPAAGHAVTVADNGSLAWTMPVAGAPLAFAFKADGTVSGASVYTESAAAPADVGIIVSETPDGAKFVVQGTVTVGEADGGVAGTVTLDPEVLETYDTLFIHGFHYED